MRRTARRVVIDFAELSDPGRDPQKQMNEDCSGYAETALGHLAVVCDGMGGHVGGRAASELAVRTILAAVASAPGEVSGVGALEGAIRTAGRAVHALGGSGADPARPGATCVALLLAERGALVAHVGDSRALLVRQGVVQRLTRDHSLVEELVAAGVLAKERAADHPEANKITRALGIEPTVEVEVRPGTLPLAVGDVLLLVTDGVTDLVADADLVELVRTRLGLGAAVLCQAVIELANLRGGHDNATVQVVHVLELPEGPHAADTLLLDGPDRPTEPALGGAPFTLDATRDGPALHMPAPRPLPRVLGAPARTVVDEFPARGPTPPLAAGPALSASDAAPRPTPRPGHELRRALLALVAVLLLAIAAVAWLRHRRAANRGEAPPALLVESAAPAPPVIATLAPAEEPAPPATAAAAPTASGSAPATPAGSPAPAPTGSAPPTRFE